MINLFAEGGYAGFDVLTLDNGERINLRELPPFLRVLLITDGTVTKILESYFWERVKVNKLAQERIELKKKCDSLGLDAGTEVIERRVSLSGASSARLYALARSILNPQALPEQLCRDLEAGRLGIGELMRERGLETHRELIKIGSDQNNINRSYRILYGGKACMEISEQFPLELYKSI